MLSQVYKTFSNCLRIPELRSRLVFTALLLFVCRLVAVTPVPGLDGRRLAEYFGNIGSSGGGNSVLGLYSLFTGGALEQCAVGALGIMPYISATIILQLLSAVIPALNKMVREEGGRAKFTAYGRYLTVILCLGQSFMLAIGWENPERAFQGFSGHLVVIDSIWQYRLQTVFILTAGTLLLMWLGEQITERGIGNGVSLVITIGILARLPNAIQSLFFPVFRSKDVQMVAWWHSANSSFRSGSCGNRDYPGTKKDSGSICSTGGWSTGLFGVLIVPSVEDQLCRSYARHLCSSYPDVPRADPREIECIEPKRYRVRSSC